MSKKLTFYCPCGFYCETVREDDVVALIQLHVTRSHGNHLPFGITKSEALALMRKEHVKAHKKKTAEHNILMVQ